MEDRLKALSDSGICIGSTVTAFAHSAQLKRTFVVDTIKVDTLGIWLYSEDLCMPAFALEWCEIAAPQH